MVRGSSERVRMAVIGAGAIGGFFAAKLQEAGHEVTVCVRTPIESLVLEQAGERRAVPFQIVTDPKVQEPVEWVFVADQGPGHSRRRTMVAGDEQLRNDDCRSAERD